ncbi:hypothetical protein Dimus_006881 [Dionaea muscipula]
MAGWGLKHSIMQLSDLLSLSVLLLVVWWSRLPYITAQSVGSSAGSPRALDALLQDYAYRAFIHPKTGVVYDGTVPANLTGIRVAALRLRNGSLRMRGVKSYKGFEIQAGVLVEPYVKRLVLVYQDLGNWSDVYYPLSGHTYLAPVLGLLAYDAANLTATNLPELDLRASLNPILVHFTNAKPVPDGVAAKCVTLDLQGSINFSKVSSTNTCSAVGQGHFALVAEATAPSPAPASTPSPSGREKKHGRGKLSTAWVIVIGVVGGLVLVILLGLMILCVKHKNKKHIQRMERAAENNEALQITPVGRLRLPAASGTRTHPSLLSFTADSSSGSHGRG